MCDSQLGAVKSWIRANGRVRDRAAYSAIEASGDAGQAGDHRQRDADTEGHAKAVARRLLYVPMERPVAREDPALGAKLPGRGSADLAPAGRGVRRWYADGADQRALRIPESWTEGKQAAMAVSDPLHEWTVNNLVYSEHNGDHISTEAIWNRSRRTTRVYADIRDFGRTLRSCAFRRPPAPVPRAEQTAGLRATGTSDGPRSDRRTLLSSNWRSDRIARSWCFRWHASCIIRKIGRTERKSDQ